MNELDIDLSAIPEEWFGELDAIIQKSVAAGKPVAEIETETEKVNSYE